MKCESYLTWISLNHTGMQQLIRQRNLIRAKLYLYFFHRRDIKLYDEDFEWPDEKSPVIKSNELPAVNNFQLKTCPFKISMLYNPNVGK